MRAAEPRCDCHDDSRRMACWWRPDSYLLLVPSSWLMAAAGAYASHNVVRAAACASAACLMYAAKLRSCRVANTDSTAGVCLLHNDTLTIRLQPCSLPHMCLLLQSFDICLAMLLLLLLLCSSTIVAYTQLKFQSHHLPHEFYAPRKCCCCCCRCMHSTN
jgi:hypothetical protein